MALIALIVMSALLPIFSITAFIIGYNVNAQKKIFKLPKKAEDPTPEQEMLDRIDKATV
jgi:hypothetical protein